MGTKALIRDSTDYYSSNFPATESPISESGRWTHVGTSWTSVQTSGGRAYGTQDNTGGFDDSLAYLKGFEGQNHTCSATVYKSGSSGIMEVELLGMWRETTSIARGYECNMAHDGSYTEIVRWNGPLNDFTYLSQAHPGGLNPVTGDIMKATFTVSGGTCTITVYLNGVQINTATDSTYLSGNPGMGFYRAGGAASSTYGFTSFTASVL